MESARSLDRLIARLSRLPGIGRKSATRIAFHLLKIPESDALELSSLIREVKEKIRFCNNCWTLSETDPCDTCSDLKRRRDQICVVEEAVDVSALIKADGYRGLFHVLGGRLSPLDGIGPDDLRVKELLLRLGDTVTEVTEVIVATNPTVEGEATAGYLSRLIKPLGVRVTRIARGLPVGSDLEFADSVTLARAIEGRQDL